MHYLDIKKTLFSTQTVALNDILKNIKSHNEKYGLLSEDFDSENIQCILGKFGIKDDEESICDYFSEIPNAINLIRDAEKGLYAR